MTDGKAKLLLDRLNDIGASLAKTGQAEALIAFGSVGLELERLDQYSDLDFFVVVQPGAKGGFLDDLSWLERIAPVAFAYRNTVDGYKLLYEDSVLCEFAVFEAHELADIPYAPGRVVWQRDAFDTSLASPRRQLPEPHADLDWLVGEALTNLYIGMSRDRRGEHLAALKLIQGHAVDRVVDICHLLRDTAAPEKSDPFAADRRFEARFPEYKPHLSGFMQGYSRNGESALAILDFLSDTVDINEAMRARIVQLCRR